MFSLHVNVVRLSKRKSKELTLVMVQGYTYEKQIQDLWVSVSKDNQSKLYFKSV